MSRRVVRRAVVKVYATAMLAALAGLFAPYPASAYTLEGGTWPSATTTFYYGLPGGTLIEATDLYLAMDNWNTATPFKFVGIGNNVDPCDSSQPNGAKMASTVCGSAFGSTTLATTIYDANSRGNITHAGTVYNSAVNFSSYSGPLRSGVIDFKRVAVHELGHVLGLDHQNNTAIPAIMQPLVSDIEIPQADDIAGVNAMYANATGTTTLVSAVLPASRSVQVGNTATAFATIINSGGITATACSIALQTPIAATLSYQATTSTNQAKGAANTPVVIAPNASQSFIIAVKPTAAFSNAIDVAFAMQCTNAPAASNTIGLNTLLLSASNTPVPDIVALAATSQNDGYVHVGFGAGSGAFAVATINLGAAGAITASADNGSGATAFGLNICQTVPATGLCMQPPSASVPVTITSNATPTFGIFVSTSATVVPDPANKRVFVRFKDASGVTRGSTSVAVTSLQ